MMFLDCIHGKVGTNPTLSNDIYSLVAFGSHVRGDYIPGQSDLDFFAVVESNPTESIPVLTRTIEECTKDMDYKILDMAWEYRENLADPLNKGFPFKFLTTWQKDFLKHHTLIHGNEIPELPVYDRALLIERAAYHCKAGLERFKGDIERYRMVSGEVAKLLTFVNGNDDISKESLVTEIAKLDDLEASLVYREYLEGVTCYQPAQFYVDFITSRTDKILRQLNS